MFYNKNISCNKIMLCLLLLIGNSYSTGNNRPININDNITINSNINNEQYDKHYINYLCRLYFSLLDENNSHCHLITEKGRTNVIYKNEIVIGNNNDDTSFNQQNYAKLYVQSNTKLNLMKCSKLQVQKDGILVNEGEIYLNEKSELISMPIDMSENSNDFTIENGIRTLKHGIDNTNGTIIFKNGSRTYWKENDSELPITIYNGTVDFSHCLRRHNKLNMKLEGVKIKLFNCDEKSACNYFNNISNFNNVHIGNNCELIGITNPENVRKIKELFAEDSNDFVL